MMNQRAGILWSKSSCRIAAFLLILILTNLSQSFATVTTSVPNPDHIVLRGVIRDFTDEHPDSRTE